MTQATIADVAAVQRIALVPSILEAVSQLTGLRFTCIARVTPETWTACAVRDQLGLGLLPYDTLDVATTFCGEVMATGMGIAVDAASDDRFWRGRAALSFYDLESFISVPIRGPEGECFGTLCGFDSQPSALSGTAALASMTLFSELISQQLADERDGADAQAALCLKLRHASDLPRVIAQVVDELRSAYPCTRYLAAIDRQRHRILRRRKTCATVFQFALECHRLWRRGHPGWRVGTHRRQPG